MKCFPKEISPRPDSARNLYLCMNYAQFKKWLESKRKELAHFASYYEDYTIKNYRAATIATEASQHAANLHLHELMRVWGEQAEVSEVDRYLVECLGAIPEPESDTLTPPEIAGQLSVSNDTVLAWIRNGELKASNIAARTSTRPKWIVRKAELDTFLKNRQPETNGKRSTKIESSFKRYST